MELADECVKFLPDVPESNGQDILNRRGFAERLASKLVDYKDPDCLIVGIHGPWGSGKTTFLGYLESKLSTNGEDVIIVHFNPWNFSTVDQLIAMFFSEMRLAIRSGKGLRETSLKIGRALERLGKILAPVEAAISIIKLPSGLVIPSGISPALEKAGSAFKDLADQDPSDLKKEINRLLGEYDKKIIILIDDIDRLDKESMRLMFRLIRLNADFINTIYILSFDRVVVESALQEEQGGSGRAYLEKFIQVPFDLPLPEHNKIIKILMEQIMKILPQPAQTEFESDRWDTFSSEFYSLFETLRDVKRYANGLQLTLPSINDEINYIDFIALEAIRIFEPDVYVKIAADKEILLGNKPPYILDLSKEELLKRRERIDVIIKCDNITHQEAIKSIVSNLFPNAGEGMYHGYGAQYRKDRRICSSDRFDNYFILTLPEGGISQKEVDRAVKEMNTKEYFEQIMREYKGKGIINLSLDRIIDYADQIPVGNIKILICSFFDIGDELIKMPDGYLNYDLEIQISRLILTFIAQLDDQTKRTEIIIDCLKHSAGFYIPLSVIFSIKRRSLDNNALLSDAAYITLSELVDKKMTTETPVIHEKLMTNQQKGYSIGDSYLSSILIRWKEVSGIKGPMDFVSQLIRDDNGLVKLLTAFLTATDTGSGLRYSLDDHRFGYLSEFIDPIIYLPRIKSIGTDIIKDHRERTAIDEFIQKAEERSLNSRKE